MRCELFEGVFFIGSGRFRYTNALNCNVYAVAGSRDTVLIDAGCGFGVSGILDSLANHGIDRGSLTGIVLTHSDWDHARGVAGIVRMTGCSVAVHRLGREIVEHGPWRAVSATAKEIVTHTPVAVDRELEDGDEIDLGGRTLRVLHTPGHTDDSIGLELDLDGVRILFSGDTVLATGRPGITTAETDFTVYRRSVERLVERRVDAILPGHGLFILEGAHEQVAYLAQRLAGKWVDVGAGQYPPPFDSGAWFLQNNPELLVDEVLP